MIAASAVGHVRLLHEAEAQQDLEHAGLDLGDARLARPPARAGTSAVSTDDDQRRLVQHLVVAQVVDERRRRLAEVLEQEHRGARDPRFDVDASSSTSAIGRSPRWMRSATSSRPRRHVAICTSSAERDQQREPTAVRGSSGCSRQGTPSRSISNGIATSERLAARPPPPSPSEHGEQHGRDDHRAGHRDAVGGGELARCAEPDAPARCCRPSAPS